MLRRFRQSLVTPFVAWLLLAASFSAAAEMGVDRFHVHEGDRVAGDVPVAGYPGAGEQAGQAAVSSEDGIPACGGGESGDCSHCQHSGGGMTHGLLPAMSPQSAGHDRATPPAGAGPSSPAQPPHRPPIA